MALPKEQFDDLVRIGSFGGEVEWNKFFALCASALGEVRLKSLFMSMNLEHSIIPGFMCIKLQQT